MKNHFLLFILLSILFTSSISSCTIVKAFQISKLNDAEMGLSSRKVEKSELNFQYYRKGVSGANKS